MLESGGYAKRLDDSEESTDFIRDYKTAFKINSDLMRDVMERQASAMDAQEARERDANNDDEGDNDNSSGSSSDNSNESSGGSGDDGGSSGGD